MTFGLFVLRLCHRIEILSSGYQSSLLLSAGCHHAFTGKAGETCLVRGFVCSLVVLLAAQLMPGLAQPAAAAFARSAGGAVNPPAQLAGSAAGRPSRVSTTATDKNPGSAVRPPAVPGAVPAQTKYSPAVLPKSHSAPQPVGAVTTKTAPVTGMTAASHEIPVPELPSRPSSPTPTAPTPCVSIPESQMSGTRLPAQSMTSPSTDILWVLPRSPRTTRHVRRSAH